MLETFKKEKKKKKILIFVSWIDFEDVLLLLIWSKALFLFHFEVDFVFIYELGIPISYLCLKLIKKWLFFQMLSLPFSAYIYQVVCSKTCIWMNSFFCCCCCCCCRFHVDKMSSAHVYLRLNKGQTVDDMSEGLLEDCAQLVKSNSIQGKSSFSSSIPWFCFSSVTWRHILLNSCLRRQQRIKQVNSWWVFRTDYFYFIGLGAWTLGELPDHDCYIMLYISCAFLKLIFPMISW